MEDRSIAVRSSENTSLDAASAPVQVMPFDIKTLLAGQLAESSIAMYGRDLKAYRDYAEAEGLDMLDVQTLAAWRDSLALTSSMSPHTINRMLSAVKRVVRQAASRGLIDANVDMRFSKLEGVKVKALKARLKTNARTRIEPDAMRRLCESPDTDKPIGKRDAAILLTLASSGLRASELATLQIGQIVKRGRGYLLSVRGKTDIEYRDAHLSPEAYNAIMAWIGARPILSDNVFTSFAGRGNRATDAAMSETAVWLVVQKYAEASGLAHIKPHDFRRFVGTQLAAKDIRKAQLALGHKSIEVTARHYVLDKLEVGETDHLF
jgi:integrase/recombinase XerD